MGIVKTALVMLGLGLCLKFILAWNASADGTGTYPAPENGDWVINDEFDKSNEKKEVEK